ncbi:hypothetical protein ANTQUA_LOCUS2546 [Anthophora quadrimaculata]
MFWYLMDGTFWCRTDTIQPQKEMVATVALDLPKFDKDPFCDAYVEETVDRSCELQFLTEIHENPERGERLLKFLEEKSFKEICADVYFTKRTGCLMYCLIEILPITGGEARLRIFSGSSHQMNIILRLLWNQFPDMITDKDVDPVFAATVLMEELKLYLEDSSTTERQMARIRTDLLIP